jgi:hypothetical protein
LRLSGHFLALEVIFILKLHDGILITFSELFHFLVQCTISFPNPCIIHLQHKIVVSSHVPVMFSLCQKHSWILVIETMHLVFEHLIEVFIHIVVLEWRPCLLVTLISLLPLLPLFDLGNLTPPEVPIPGLGVMLFSGSGYVSYIHLLH